MSQLRQVLVKVRYKEESVLLDDEFIINDTFRLVTVDPFRAELPESLFKDNVKQQDDLGNPRPAAELLKDYEIVVKQYMDANHVEINNQIKLKEIDQVTSSVKEYYGENFVSCEVLETIGLSKTLGVVS